MEHTQFHDLRTELADALYQAGGCQTDFCTNQICCVPIAKLMDKPTISLSSALGFRNGYLPSLYEFQLNHV